MYQYDTVPISFKGDMPRHALLSTPSPTIGCSSCKFMDTELKYLVGQQEVLAAFEGCRHFHNIIYGCKHTICSNHMNITHANKGKGIELKLQLFIIEA